MSRKAESAKVEVDVGFCQHERRGLSLKAVGISRHVLGVGGEGLRLWEWGIPTCPARGWKGLFVMSEFDA